jgi:hypothetical protein
MGQDLVLVGSGLLAPDIPCQPDQIILSAALWRALKDKARGLLNTHRPPAPVGRGCRRFRRAPRTACLPKRTALQGAWRSLPPG